MKYFQWYHLLSVSLVIFTLFHSGTIRADIGAGPITCTQGSVNTIGEFAFGTVDPLSSQTSTSATLNYECKGNGNRASARVCFTFGPLASTDMYRDIPGPNNSIMNFSLFSDPSLSNIITSANPLQATFNTETSAKISRSMTVHAQTLAKQTTLFPGSYFLQQQVFMTVNSVEGSTAPANCITPVEADISSTYQIPYTSRASVSAHCSVTTTGSLELGSVAASTSSTSGSSANLINVTCTNDTPYNIGLSPSNGDNNGAGVMTGSGSNSDLVPYQLRSTPGLSGTPWGNTATSTNLGNGVAGIGTGAAQNKSVYATVPSADFKPDTYSDIVTISVNY